MTKVNMKITHLKCHKNLAGANDLNRRESWRKLTIVLYFYASIEFQVFIFLHAILQTNQIVIIPDNRHASSGIVHNSAHDVHLSTQYLYWG